MKKWNSTTENSEVAVTVLGQFKIQKTKNGETRKRIKL
jgi:hypothetical protein